MNGRSWLLGGGHPWFSADPSADGPGTGGTTVVADPEGGLSLATLPGGPLGLDSLDDSLGRLTLPRGAAVDGETVLVLSEDGGRVYRYDSIRVTLDPLPEVGVEGLLREPREADLAEPRRFSGAANVAAHHGVLYVADPRAHRVQVFDLATLALIRIHPRLDDPADVASSAQGVFLLDRGRRRVYRALPARDSLELVIDGALLTRRWDRIAIDRDGRVYLRDSSGVDSVIDVFRLGTGCTATCPVERVTNSAPIRDRFETPPVQMDGRGDLVLSDRLSDPCGLGRSRNGRVQAWAIGKRSYVLDARNRSVEVRLDDGRLRHRFGPYDSNELEVRVDDPSSWAPVDLVVVDGCVFVLDERHQAVHAHVMGAETLKKRFQGPPDSERRWRRIAQDGRGGLLLWDGIGDEVDRVDPSGRVLGTLAEREARQHFLEARPTRDPIVKRPAVRLTRGGALPPAAKGPRWVDSTFERVGTWTSQWLDGGIHDCPWDVLELEELSLPPGSSLSIRTRTSNEKDSPERLLATLTAIGSLGSWRDTPRLTGPAQPDADEALPRTTDMLVPSGPGRYLQIQVELSGDGVRSPALGRLRARFPRESLLAYLPAIYSKPDEQREFLDRLLSICQATWSPIENEVETFERFLDPDSVPDAHLAFLARWLDLQLEGTWTPEQNRRLLQAMPKLMTKWGTVEGLREWLQVYLAHLAGISVDEVAGAGMPRIVENFVNRRRLALDKSGMTALGSSPPLWGPSVERRFQLGVFDREGEVELVSTEKPEIDFVRRDAHAFRVYAPAAWVRTPDDEALLRRAIDFQKPAHTTYELILIEPRLRIGQQSTVDLDSVIGAPEPSTLACPTVEEAPSRPPRRRLGYDATLGGERSHRVTSLLERSLA